MSVILGVLFHFLGGFASGSFYIPFKKIKEWSWERYWIVGGLFSWLIAPPLAAWLTVPGFADIIANTNNTILGLTFFMDVLWGIGGLTYGLGIRYLGMSLGNSVILGYCAAFDALIPTIYYDYFPKEGKISRNYIFAAVAGITWFLQFFFYGMGESKLGNGASSWILHMAFIILIANMWGILLKEWKGVNKKTAITITLGIITILASVVLVGYGNSLPR